MNSDIEFIECDLGDTRVGHSGARVALEDKIKNCSNKRGTNLVLKPGRL